MREMVLNHASVDVPAGIDPHDWLADLARGMAKILNAGVAEKWLRMHLDMSNVWCRPGLSLWDACYALRPHYRDEHLFLMRLAQKAPVGRDLDIATKERLLSCEAHDLPVERGEPLVLCAIEDWIAVSFPSASHWDRSQLHITFDELLPDGVVQPVEEVIDNLSRSTHAVEITERVRQQYQPSSAAELWKLRRSVFPHVHFGPDVEGHLDAHASLLPKITRKLESIEASTRAWVDGPAPHWRTAVTPESATVMQNPKTREARRFRSARGGHHLFEWHARVGSKYRIHLRLDAADHSVEIGYIGPHLPT